MINPDWHEVRQAMLLPPDVAYLNTGSYGIVPRVVFEQLTDLRRQLQSNPVDFLWRRSGESLWQARARLAEFLHVEPRRLIFTLNVSLAINIVANSLRLAAPGEVLLTDHEYGAMRYAWERAAQVQGLTLRTVKLPLPMTEPGDVVRAVREAMSPATRLLFVSHVLYTTGAVLPVKELCAESRQRGIITVIDGAHAPGMLPLDLQDLGCDFYAANLHKWLLAPLGAGFLYVAPGLEDRIQPLVASWGWHYDRTRADERDEYGGTHRLRSYEFEGSRDICPWLAVPAAIEFQEGLGPAFIRARHRELSDRVRARLTGLPGLDLVTPEHSTLRGGLTAFRLGSFDFAALRKLLWETHRIEINIVEALPGTFLRVSTHFYNLEEEVDRLAAVLPEALRLTWRPEGLYNAGTAEARFR
jgi:isopenicillin-N epimerase